MSIYDLTAVDIDGNTRSLSEWKGKVLMITNVASACGYTHKVLQILSKSEAFRPRVTLVSTQEYQAMSELFNKHESKGFDILAFPCNQFGQQESKCEADIKSFATSKYGVRFSMFSKIDVNGAGTSPVYQLLKSKFPGDIRWNFATKFLVGRDGAIAARVDGSTQEAEAQLLKLL